MKDEYKPPVHYLGSVENEDLALAIHKYLCDRYSWYNIEMHEHDSGVFSFRWEPPNPEEHLRFNIWSGQICASIRAFEAGWNTSHQHLEKGP